MFRFSSFLIGISIAIFSLVLPGDIQAAEERTAMWQAYDESDDLAELSQHEDDSMHFKLLNSRVTDKNDLWAPFQDDLSNFSESIYQTLKPLIMERSVRQIQQAVASGQLSYELLSTFYVYRIRKIESDDERFLNAVISLNPNAIRRAQVLDDLREAGQEIAEDSLFGIPVLLKDNIGFAGLATTAGALALKDNQTGNSFIAQQLMDNGAIILGKANLSEWAYFFCDDCPSGYSALGGQTLNPYGRFQHGTGGSSSGSGASVAANFAAVAVGSETSGSILSPASANSAVGLKPTTGTLSRTGVVPISATLDTTGPITRTVEDAVILFNAMAGYDEVDMAMPLRSADSRLQYRLRDIGAIRMGIISDFENDSHYQNAVSLLTQIGASAVSVNFSPPEFEKFLDLLGGEMVRDLALYLSQHAAGAVEISSIDDLQEFNQQDLDIRAPYGQALIDMMADLNIPATELHEIREQLQSSARGYLDLLFAENDLQILLSINNRNAGIAALANYPALTVPMDYAENGQPVGLTLIAPSFQEQLLIDLGAQFERLSNARIIPEQYR